MSEKQLNSSQIKVAKHLVERGMLVGAGHEADRSAVYRLTEAGKLAMEMWG